ncbi:MAG: LysR family transcriptional regulator [Gammaproteobacteria bacterium]|uniref:LysR family transcriptional regulator n=1 Tax=SAR86 cluster bacterium TaxID=2030880 RepID=A0A520MWY0_9GAMM|nr:LysR family transcriptional regulator [Gammaproteobacteria bacterium]MBA4730130.1 LysR family transcriptional regulator [SAR86 cluster bacterium]RPG34759.1 MAG: LysR family transcriptional regulator [Gammaproteobacteria bacterium TMED193]RZO25738.1 MAG: LysR family transcriptional regulator [SAR86 cluster bacterium]|tara:strand:+ start:4985 stop:5887 length:903 start_codon:yes stop_codon:yes gene_type:complete
MKLNNLDLNLLVVFNAIYAEGSLTKAGEIVGITQPAVSSALSKLRDYFDDQLFIRVGQGVKPTAKTENIIIHVRDALSILQRSLEQPDSFDPKISSRNFRLSLNDVSEGRILPILITKINKQAPHVKISSYYTNRDDMHHALVANEVNFAVDPFPPPETDTIKELIFEDEFVCGFKKDHPLAKEKTLSIEQYLELDHIHISGRRTGGALVDNALSKLQLNRRVSLRAQHYLITPEILRNSDMVLTCTSTFAKKHNLAFKKLPFDVAPSQFFLAWHQSNDADPGHIWLRGLIKEAFQEAKF